MFKDKIERKLLHTQTKKNHPSKQKIQTNAHTKVGNGLGPLDIIPPTGMLCVKNQNPISA